MRYEALVQQACHPENFLPDNFIEKESRQTLDQFKTLLNTSISNS
jgi:hypothetical protein